MLHTQFNILPFLLLILAAMIIAQFCLLGKGAGLDRIGIFRALFQQMTCCVQRCGYVTLYLVALRNGDSPGGGWTVERGYRWASKVMTRMALGVWSPEGLAVPLSS